jgi:hypothetical protein
MTRQKRAGSIAVVLIAAATTALAFAASATARLTGEFAKFQHCPHDDSEVDLSVEAAILEDPFLGLNCYVGSTAEAARASIPTETTTRTNAPSRLTFSPA